MKLPSNPGRDGKKKKREQLKTSVQKTSVQCFRVCNSLTYLAFLDGTLHPSSLGGLVYSHIKLQHIYFKVGFGGNSHSCFVVKDRHLWKTMIHLILDFRGVVFCIINQLAYTSRGTSPSKVLKSTDRNKRMLVNGFQYIRR